MINENINRVEFTRINASGENKISLNEEKNVINNICDYRTMDYSLHWIG
jgi:hypothetical protein